MSAPAYAASPEEESAHVVKAGETLGGIANRAGVSATAIAKANGLKEPYVVRLGQKLTIPRAAKVAAKPATAKPSPKPTPKPTPSVPSAELSAKKAEKTAARVIEARQPSGSPETETSHKVGEGETLGGIAARAKVPRVLIIEANGLQAPFDVRVGQTLRIPRTRRHEVKNGDTGFSISLDYAVPWEQIALANNLDANAPVKVGQNLLIPTLLDPPGIGAKTLSPAPRPAAAPVSSRPARFAWPLSGPVRRGYASGSDYHDGVDITAPKGAMVRAAAAGTVTFAGKEKSQFGNLVVLDHGDGWFTAYGFLSRVTVKEGAKVAAGERVGLVGDTGLAKGSELHFEVRQDGKPVDPLGELPKSP
ncbi:MULTISPECIES: LysM peptidoglycan-binding domain-containing M23 family metallopeptidase [unclassified Novosphingobium]